MKTNKFLLIAIILFLLSSLFISRVDNYILRVLWDCVGAVLGIWGLGYAIIAIYRKFIKGLSAKKIAIFIAANIALILLLAIYFESRAYRTGIIDQARLAVNHSQSAEMVLGSNIRIGMARGIEISELFGSGTIDIIAYVSGDRSKGKIYIHGIEAQHKWELTGVQIVLDDGRSVVIKQSLP